MDPILKTYDTKAELRAKLEREFSPEMLKNIEELHAQGRDDAITELIKRCTVVHPGLLTMSGKKGCGGVLMVSVEIVYPEGGFPDLGGDSAL